MTPGLVPMGSTNMPIMEALNGRNLEGSIMKTNGMISRKVTMQIRGTNTMKINLQKTKMPTKEK